MFLIYRYLEKKIYQLVVQYLLCKVVGLNMMEDDVIVIIVKYFMLVIVYFYYFVFIYFLNL